MCKRIKNSIYTFILPSDDLGGAERVVYQLIHNLLIVNNNSNVELILLSKRGGSASHIIESLRADGNLSVRKISSKTELLGAIKLACHFITDRSERFFFTTHLHTNFFISFLRRFWILKPSTHVMRESTVIFDRFKGFKLCLFKLFYLFYYKPNLIIAQTDYMASVLKENLAGRLESKILTVPNPINQSLFMSVGRNCQKSSLNNDSAFKIVVCGKLNQNKNVKLVLNALASQMLRDFNFHLVIIGEGQLRRELETLASALGLSAKVTFTGYVESPYRYLKGADLGIISSFHEGFPNVILEMMASSVKNIISTQCSPEINKLKSVSTLCSWESSELARAIYRAAQEKVDYTPFYKAEVDKRTVENYWNQITENIK